MNQTNIKSNISLLVIFLIYCAGFFLWALARVPLILYVMRFNIVSYVGLVILIVMCGKIIAQLFRQSSKLFKTLSIALLVFTCPVNCLSAAAIMSMPAILDKASVNGITYYLVEEPEALDVHVYYSLYKCTAFGFKCSRTSFYWGPTTGDMDLYLMQDNNNPNEVYVQKRHYSNASSDLMYSAGTHSIYYDYHVSDQLSNHLYYLAYTKVPDEIYLERSRIYMLFQCDLDNTNCVRLPFQYQTDGRYLHIETNDTNNEISILETKDFDMNKVSQQYILIYTYNDKPRCYVEGCVISDK